jgi:putative salt-induced outer membrane protein
MRIRVRPTGCGVAAIVALSTTALAQAATPTTSFTGDVGFVSAAGNTRLTTLSINEKIAHAQGRVLLTQLAAYVYGKAKGVESANQLRLAGRGDYTFQRRLGAFLGVAHERNRYAGFTARTEEIAGLRWQAIVAPMDSLSIDGGGVLTQQSNVDGTSQRDPSARAAANYKHLFSKLAYFQQLAEYVPNLDVGGAYRLNTESALVAPISTHVGIKLSYTVRYDSRPPAGFGTTDRVLTTGIQVSY